MHTIIDDQRNNKNQTTFGGALAESCVENRRSHDKKS